METHEVEHLVSRMDGWLTEKEGVLLYNLARNCQGKGVIAEIGSWKGKSTIWLAYGSKQGKNVRIYAIDPHTGSSSHREKYGSIWTFDEFQKNIRDAGVDDIITSLVKTSEEAARSHTQPVELIFIDGAHTYELVKMDFDLWFPKVIEGGIMAFHDTAYPWGVSPNPASTGPQRVVDKFVYGSRHFRNIRLVDSITIAQKVKQNSVIDRLSNRCALTLKHLYEKDIKSRLLRKVPKPIKEIGRLMFRTSAQKTKAPPNLR